MNIIPNTVVRLLKDVPLYKDNENTLWFDSLSEQTSYFSTKTYKQFEKFTYQRKERNYIAVSENADKLYDYNYLMFQNQNYTNKWFYAFIDEIEYRNPDTTFIYYTIDVFQTWLTEMDYTSQQCFIDREHTKRYYPDGSPIVNTLPENLEIGSDYEVVGTEQWTQKDDISFLILCTKGDITKRIDSSDYWESPTFGNVTQSLNYFIIPFLISRPTVNVKMNGMRLSNLSHVQYTISTKEELVNTVVSMTVTSVLPFMIYGTGSELTCDELQPVHGNDLIMCRPVNGAKFRIHSIDFGNKYDGFPDYEESKLLMYPYSYTELTDFRGNSFIIKNEYLPSTWFRINVLSNLSFKNKIAYMVGSYNGSADNSLEYGIIDTDTMEMPVIDDYSAAYVQGNKNSLINAQNIMSQNNQIGVGSGLVGMLGGILTGNIGGVVGGATQAFNTNVSYQQQVSTLNAKMQDIENIPPTLSKQGNDSTFSMGYDYRGFFLVKKTIKKEYADILTNYFKMYGYRTNRLGIIIPHNRQCWNYIKTVGCNISGSIPQDDLMKLRSMFDKGITLWHDDLVGNYDRQNKEI